MISRADVEAMFAPNQALHDKIAEIRSNALSLGLCIVESTHNCAERKEAIDHLRKCTQIAIAGTYKHLGASGG